MIEILIPILLLPLIFGIPMIVFSTLITLILFLIAKAMREQGKGRFQ